MLFESPVHVLGDACVERAIRASHDIDKPGFGQFLLRFQYGDFLALGYDRNNQRRDYWNFRGMIPTSSDFHTKGDAMISPKIPKSSVGPVEPMSMCVNMIYDPGPITQAERMAARNFVDSVGGLERAKEVLRHIQPADLDSPKE